MHCANPGCGRAAEDIRFGMLRLLEMDVLPDERITGSDAGFPVCAVPSRYFWLCEECSKTLSIRKWTKAGIVLAPRNSRVPFLAATPVRPVSVRPLIQRHRLAQIA